VADWLNSYVVKQHADKETLRQEWMATDDRWAARAGWSPLFLVPGGLLGDAPASPARAGRWLAAFPSSPADPEAMAGHRRLAEIHHLPGDHLPAQLAALAGSRILAEGLKRAGRELTPEALVLALEELRDFRTGFAPPVSYGQNRRIGALGAYVFEIDPAGQHLSPVTGWEALPQQEP